jgi:hypothetical protein
VEDESQDIDNDLDQIEAESFKGEFSEMTKSIMSEKTRL